MALFRPARCPSKTAAFVTPRRRRFAMAAAAGAIMLSAAAAHAAMLDPETCRKLKTEHDSMNASGLREMLAKGPDWAKSNLTKERMDQLKRFLTVEEDVRFRCPLGKARPELEAAESEAGATTALQPGEAAPGAPAPPASAAAKPARKPKPPAKAAASDAEAQGSGSPGPAAQKSAASSTRTAAKKNAPAAAVPAPAASDGTTATPDDANAEVSRKKPR